MDRRLVVEFTKMNGAGNDFIVIDNRFYFFSEEELARLAQQICPRRTGIGADGLLLLMPPEEPANAFRMLYFNADGSRATMCGNAARCLALFARFAGITQSPLTFESDAGIYGAIVPDDPTQSIRVMVQPPLHFEPLHQLATPLPAGGSGVAYIWTGTEHVVCYVDDLEGIPLEVWGPQVRHDESLAPDGANVNFAALIEAGGEGEKAQLNVRTFEKGVEGETLACGTGALATGIVTALSGRTDASEFDIHMPGGTLTVGFDRRENRVENVYLEGPAETVYRGSFEWSAGS